MRVGQLCFITAAGRYQGAKVNINSVHAAGDVADVTFAEARGPYKVGDLAQYLVRDLVAALDPGERVAYHPDYLRANRADPREYGRTARVVKRMEGALVQLEWSDGMGPQTDTTAHLQVLKHGGGGVK
jgi:hypothetical protein